MKVVVQHDERDCGAACFCVICHHYGLKISISEARNLICTDCNGTNLLGITDGAHKIGLNADALQGNIHELIEEFEHNNGNPFIARVIVEEVLEHYIVVYKINHKYVWIIDPRYSKKIKISIENFTQIWTGYIVNFSKSEKFVKNNKTKGEYCKYFKLVLEYRRKIFAIIVFAFIISCLSIINAYVLQYIIDSLCEQITEKGNFVDKLSSVCAALSALFIFQAILGLLLQVISLRIKKKIQTRITNESIKSLFFNRYSFFDNYKTGQIMLRIEDSQRIGYSFLDLMLAIIINISILITIGIIILLKNKIVFVMSIIFVIINCILLLFYKKPIDDTNRVLLDENAEYSALLKENIDGIEIIKSGVIENKIINKLNRVFENVQFLTSKYLFLKSSENIFLDLIMSLFSVFVIIYSAYLVMQRDMTVGELVMLYSITSTIHTPLVNLFAMQPEVQSLKNIINRLNDIHEEKKDVDTQEIVLRNISLTKSIEFSNVVFGYGNREVVLDGLNLKIHSGDKVAIFGKSGSGKTTIAKLMLRLYRESEGDILIGENHIDQISLELLRKKIGYVSQNFSFFTDTIRNNLIGNKDSINESQIFSVLDKCNCLGFLEKLPDGIDTILYEDASNLSMGERQRLAIARELIKQPDIFIFDEPTSNLDIYSERCIVDLIKSLNATCIIISHKKSILPICDEIYVLKNGRIFKADKEIKEEDFSDFNERSNLEKQING